MQLDGWKQRQKEHKELELLINMRAQLIGQVREREQLLIAQKRELHTKQDALEDLQYELEMAERVLEGQNEELFTLDQSIAKMMDAVQKQTVRPKPVSKTSKTSASIEEGRSFNFLGMLKTRNVEDNIEKVERYGTSR